MKRKQPSSHKEYKCVRFCGGTREINKTHEIMIPKYRFKRRFNYCCLSHTTQAMHLTLKFKSDRVSIDKARERIKCNAKKTKF